jgi:hypothetical protein
MVPQPARQSQPAEGPGSIGPGRLSARIARMAIRTRDFIYTTNLAWLRVCRGLLKKMRCPDSRDENDRLAALTAIDRMIARFESRVDPN